MAEPDESEIDSGRRPALKTAAAAALTATTGAGLVASGTSAAAAATASAGATKAAGGPHNMPLILTDAVYDV
jgi:hypothetical protein